jgi:hypothetical protein
MHGARRRVRFRTRKQAEMFLSETSQRAARGEYAEPAKIPTFVEVAEDWLQSKTDRRPSHVFATAASIRSCISLISGRAVNLSGREQGVDAIAPNRQWVRGC